MSRAALILPLGAVLAACKPAAEPVPTPVEQVSAAPAVSDAAASAPAALTAADLRRVCRAGLAMVHGQTPDAIQVDSVVGDVVAASWRAPVDGGRMRAECRVEGELVTWKPVDRPDPAQNRWMNQAGDPVTKFLLDGDRIVVTQTLPDGTSEQSEVTVPVEQEAR